MLGLRRRYTTHDTPKLHHPWCTLPYILRGLSVASALSQQRHSCALSFFEVGVATSSCWKPENEEVRRYSILLLLLSVQPAVVVATKKKLLVICSAYGKMCVPSSSLAASCTVGGTVAQFPRRPLRCCMILAVELQQRFCHFLLFCRCGASELYHRELHKSKGVLHCDHT